MRKTYTGNERYSGRAERKEASASPDLSKTPHLRTALVEAVANGHLSNIAEQIGCKAKDLKSFAHGSSSLRTGLQGRLISYMRNTL